MNRNEIVEYYSNLVNEIEHEFDRTIYYVQTEENIVNKINSDRAKIISKIKEIEINKLKNLKDSESIYDGLFCFFILPKHSFALVSKMNDDRQHKSTKKLKTDYDIDQIEYKLKLEAKDEYFESRNQIGQLIVLNCTLNKKIVENLIDHCIDPDENQLNSFEDLVKVKVLTQLIESYRDEIIIDLTNKENNKIATLELKDDFQQLDENNLSFIETILNIQSVQELNLKNYFIYEIPNNFFRPFKYLTKLNLNAMIERLDSNVFNGLENLETLKVSNTLRLIAKSDALKELINLKKLILYKVDIKNLELLTNLQNLKKLVLKKCEIECFETKKFDGLKSLESLKLFENKFK
ncbi:unnamed protein product, partial [Brachionus calyciflorus]